MAKRRPTPPQIRHAQHPVIVRPGAGPHAARLWCLRCSKHIQWITQTQADFLKGN
jgi:hypothetical protein